MDKPHINERRTPPHVDAGEIGAHVTAARAAACPDCAANTAVLAGDIAALLAEAAWCCRALIRARQRAANLEAAIGAALGALEDGEHDPAWYLRDELNPGRRGRV